MSSNEEIINKLNGLKDEFMSNLYKDKTKADEVRAQIKQVLQDAPDGTEMYRVIQETSSGWTSHGSYSDTRATMKTLKKENGVWEMYGRKRDSLDDAVSSIVYNDGKLMSKSDAEVELDKLKVNDSSSHRDIVNVGTDKWGNPIGKSTNRIEYPNKKEEDNGMLTPIPDELKQPSELKPWTADMYMEYYFKMANAVAEEYKEGDIDFIKSRMRNYNLPETEITDENIKQVINDIAFAYADEKAKRYKSIKTEALDDGVMLVSTGLNDAKAEDILNSVIGQMSDGIWENTPQMNRYWKYLDVVKQDGELYLKVDTDNYSSGFKGYTEDEVREFVAHKVKQIAKIYIEDYAHAVKGLAWDRNCTEKCDYLDYHSGATIQDAYRVYDKLLGRKDRIKTEAYFICGRCLRGIDLDYNAEDYVVDPETGEEMCIDCAIEAGIPVEGDDDLQENKEITKHREDKLNKLQADILYNFNEAYKDWGKDMEPSKTAFVDTYMDAFQDDFSYGDVNWRDYIVAIPELDNFYKEYSDVEDYEIPEDMKLKFYNLITEYVHDYLKGVCADKVTENKSDYIGEPLSEVLSSVGDGLDVADATYDMMVWMPSYTEEDDLSDTFDKLVQFIEQKISVKETFNPSEDAVIIADVAGFIKDNKQVFIDEINIPEEIKTDEDIEEYLVCTAFPSIVSGYATDSLYTNIYNKLNGGK